ncbi:MFS transporter [Motiliproteus sp. MSK22-1]|uniref:MFS transporter n=1 Tax=Motiliproteus sp. MSK22-1 TaxID=1897630 RepID=UPI000977BF96|nr:MFS transporter [Motiliproteus sp. MSK22-1]OMH38714.1 MFS transporter [Motiliproteus sp. MSK22-1]
MRKDSLPYWRLSSFYLCYFALLGAIVPYWGLYLEHLGFDAGEIGSLMAILMGTRIIAPNLWGWLADRTGKRLSIIRIGSFLTFLVFSAAFWSHEYWQMALLMFSFTFFWNAVLPQYEVITLHALGDQRARYSQVRLWGSVGFIIAVVLLGGLFEQSSISLLIPLSWAGMALIWITTLFAPRQPNIKIDSTSAEFLGILRRPEVIIFFLVSLLIQLGHGPYYTFYSIYMSGFGYTKVDIGLLWALGVAAEVVMFIVMHRALGRIGLRNMVMSGLLVCTIRWCLIGAYPHLFSVVIIAQIMHAVTFGCLHAAGIALVQSFFPAGTQGQGQALYSSFGFGVGGALGAYGSGLIWTTFGGGATFFSAAVISLIGLFLAWKGLRID